MADDMFETTCAVVTGETRRKIFEVFGDSWWNDHEDVHCIPVDMITAAELDKLKKLGLVPGPNAKFLIAYDVLDVGS